MAMGPQIPCESLEASFDEDECRREGCEGSSGKKRQLSKS